MKEKPSKRDILRGPNITFNCRNKQEKENLRKHSRFIFKEVQLKYPEQPLIDEKITDEKKVSMRPLTSKTSDRVLRTRQKNRNQAPKCRTWQTNQRAKSSFPKKRTTMLNERSSFEQDLSQIVVKGWDSLVEGKKISRNSVSKIKDYRNTIKTIRQRSAITSSLHQKQNSKSQIFTKILPFKTVISADPTFLCQFSTGLTQKNNENYSKITSLHKSSQLIDQSQFLTQLYKKTVKSKHYSELMTEQVDHNFLSMVYFLQRYRNQCHLTQKQKMLMQKCKFI